MRELSDEMFKRELMLVHTGAALQRAKKMPALKKLLGDAFGAKPKPISMKTMLEKLKAAPVLERRA